MLLMACAKQGLPPGGPVDTEPPEVISTKPKAGATGVDVRTAVSISFSEWMDTKTLKGSVFISPIPEQAPEVKVKSKKVEIHFVDELNPDQTYVITVGTGAKDLRGNGLQSSLTFAFSTGGGIDTGRISGRVLTWRDNVEGAYAWAYSLNEDAQPDPSIEPPDYITQANGSGLYSFTYLSSGRYRLFAFQDTDRDGRYTIEQDPVGVGAVDVFLTPGRPTVENVDFLLAVQDTTRPECVSVKAADRSRVDIAFSEPVDPGSVGTIRITSAADTVPLEIRSAFVGRTDRSLCSVLTGLQRPEIVYEVTCCEVMDTAGNCVSSQTCQQSFVGTEVVDTLRPRVVAAQPQDSALNVPLDVKIACGFSEAVDTSEIHRSFRLTEENGDRVSGRIEWSSPAAFVFIPRQELKGQSHYRVTLDTTVIGDAAGNRLLGAGTEIFFTTLNPDTLGHISGRLADEENSVSGLFFVRAENVDDEYGPFLTSVSEAGAYELRNLMPGWYRVWAFRDADGNGDYSHGNPFPITFSERFTWYPDTVEVRSRWETQGIDLVLRAR